MLLAAVAIPEAYMRATRVDFAATMRSQLEKQGQLTPEQMETTVRISAAFSKGAAIFSPLFPVVIVLVVAAMLWFLFRLFGSDGTYRGAISVTAFSWLPLSLASILRASLLATRTSITGEEFATLLKSNLAFLTDMATQPGLFIILGSIDLFVIWALILLTLGFAHLSKFSRARSAALVFSFWFGWVLVMSGLVAVASGMKKG
jgi:hypothetical protein